nr:hypothetical protein [uncultured Sulfurimonas sp.]
MGFSLFKKKSNLLKFQNSQLVKKLKEVSKTNNFSIYENITIYHHAQSYNIPFLLVNPKKGIYLFEDQEWSYDDLKDATISKATNQQTSHSTLAFDKTHSFIKQKFNELIHNDGIAIYNFLLLENISSEEYKFLDKSFKELLPQEKIIFNNLQEASILEKLDAIPEISESILKEVDIIGNLLVQYLIFSKDSTMHLASNKQMHFIDSIPDSLETLSGNAYSGKTNAIVLKAILMILKNPDLKIIIIEPTTLACDKLKQKLLNIVEYAIIEIDLTAIEIITPIDLVNRHLSKLKKPNLEIVLHIDKKLMQKKFNAADYILCDDANLLSFEFITYLKHLQKNSLLLLVNEITENKESTYIFDETFKDKQIEIVFKQTNEYAKSLQIISQLLQENSSSDILVVSNNLTKRKLHDDLEFFIKDKAVLLDSSNNLISQELDNLLLSSYTQISSMNTKFIILMDIAEASLNEVEHAINLAQEKAYVLYENESENIKILKDIHD